MSTPPSDGDRSSRLEAAVAAEIRAELARRQIEQAQLAEMLGEHPSWVSRLLGRSARTRRITLGDLERIAEALQMRVSDFLPGEADRHMRVGAAYGGAGHGIDHGSGRRAPVGRRASEDTVAYVLGSDRATEKGPIGRPAAGSLDELPGGRRARRIDTYPPIPRARQAA